MRGGMDEFGGGGDIVYGLKGLAWKNPRGGGAPQGRQLADEADCGGTLAQMPAGSAKWPDARYTQ